MTFIIGLNLSDRLYLAGDTRVTHGDGKYSDDALKVSPLLDRAIFPNNEIGIAVAGNVALATYFKNKISQGLRMGVLSPDIRRFCSEITHFLEDAIVEWVNSGNLYVSCCLLFGGVFNGRKKRVNAPRLQELLKDFETSKKQQEKKFLNGMDSLKDDPIFKLLNQKITKATGISAIGHIEKSRIPHIPTIIGNSIGSVSGEIDCPDSLIFSARVEVATKSIKIEMAEWGEFLAYGDRVKKENIPSGLLSNLELWYGNKKEEFAMGAAILSTTILDYAKDFGIQTIGGSVIIMPINERGAYITGRDLVLQPGNTHVVIDGVAVPLVPFFHYHKKKKAGLDLMAKCNPIL